MLEHLEERIKATTEAQEVSSAPALVPEAELFPFHGASVLVFTWKLRYESLLSVTSPSFFLIMYNSASESNHCSNNSTYLRVA